MLSLFLSLGSPTSRVRNINAVLGHNREARQPSFGGLWSVLLRLLRHTGSSSLSTSRRSHAHRAIRRVAEGSRRARRRSVDWGEPGGCGLSRALLKHGIAGPWRREDSVYADEGASVKVDGRILVAKISSVSCNPSLGRMGNIQVKSNLRDLVLPGCRTGDIGIDQFLELEGVESRLELEGSTQEGLDLELVHLVVQRSHGTIERRMFKKLREHSSFEPSECSPRSSNFQVVAKRQTTIAYLGDGEGGVRVSGSHCDRGSRSGLSIVDQRVSVQWDSPRY
jgi:hypothetical protein